MIGKLPGQYVGGLENVPPLKGDWHILATNASFSFRDGVSGAGFISTTGKYGFLGCNEKPEEELPEVVAELRAIWVGVQALPEERYILLCNSPVTLQYVSDWARGSLDYPRGYVVARRGKRHKRLTLVQLALQISRNPELYDPQWVPDNHNHPLSIAAGTLAELAVRVQRQSLGKYQAITEARRIVISTLTTYAKA